MGEYADDYIEAAISGEFDWGFSPRKYSRPKMPSCEVCHKTHLYWVKDERGNWYTAEFDRTRKVYEKHVCKFRWK